MNDSCYTNIIASLSLSFGIEIFKLFGVEAPTSWSHIIKFIKIPFDNSLQIHLEYDGYNGTSIKQADVTLLQYPLMYPMPRSVAYNDLVYYQNRTGFFFFK